MHQGVQSWVWHLPKPCCRMRVLRRLRKPEHKRAAVCQAGCAGFHHPPLCRLPCCGEGKGLRRASVAGQAHEHADVCEGMQSAGRARQAAKQAGGGQQATGMQATHTVLLSRGQSKSSKHTCTHTGPTGFGKGLTEPDTHDVIPPPISKYDIVGRLPLFAAAVGP